MPTHHHVDFFELPTVDVEAAKAFYAAAFGWSFVDYGPDYADVRGAGVSGGLRKVEVAPPRGGSLVIVYSDALEASELAITRAGGAITERHELAVWTKA